MKMNQILSNNLSHVQSQESKYYNSSSYEPSTLTFLNGKVYDVDARLCTNSDGRMIMPKESFLFDYDKIQKQGATILGASGKDTNPREDVISGRFLSMYEDFERIEKEIEHSSMPYTLLGAAGSTTSFEVVRRSTDLTDVVGLQYTNEDYTAHNVATKRHTNAVRFTRPRKTSSLNTVQREIGDDQEPEPERITLAEGTIDIFADAIQYVKSMRDEVDTTVSPASEFNKEIAGMFAKEKDDKITEKINIVTGINQGDWDAVTGSFYDVNAATQVQVQEDAVKGYGRPLVGLFADDAWRAYFENIRAPLTAEAASSTSTDMGGVKLPKNPNVTAWVNSDLTAGTYVIVAKPSYMDLFLGPVIQTSFKNVRTSGQNEHRFWFDFNGILENTTSAIGKGTSVLA